MDEVGECLCEDGRAHDTARIEGEPRRHPEDAELIPRDEEPQKAACVKAGAAPVALVQEIVVLGDGEGKQDEHEVLTGAADLCIGKAALSVDDISADAAERADVREQRGDEMCTAVDGAVEPPSEETPTDKSRKEDDKRKEKGQDEHVLGQRQSPETEE